jgi:hypothetical protein
MARQAVGGWYGPSPKIEAAAREPKKNDPPENVKSIEPQAAPDRNNQQNIDGGW